MQGQSACEGIVNPPDLAALVNNWLQGDLVTDYSI